MRTSLLLPVLLGAALGAGAPAAMASTVTDSIITVVEDGEVTLSYDGMTASLQKTLVLIREDGTELEVFDTETARAGDTFSLGTFEAGETISFRMDLHESRWEHYITDVSFYTTGMGRNPLGMTYTRMDQLAADVAMIGFEDLVGGGDRDFDDLVFRLNNASLDALANPIPGAAFVMATGLAGVAAARRKLKAKA